MQTILVALSSIFGLLVCMMVLFRRQFTWPDTLLLLALTGLIVTELLNLPAVGSLAAPLTLERWSLASQGLAVWALAGFSLAYARISRPHSMSWLKALFLSSCGLLLLIPLTMPAQALFSPPLRQTPWIIPLTKLGFYHHLGLLIAVLWCLFNLEATLVNATHVKRWRIKFFVLGLMAILTAQFLVVSQELLYSALDLSQSPTRGIGVLLGVVLMGYSLATRGGEQKIIFSHRLAYKSLVIFAAGIYLISIGLIGQAGQHFGFINKSAIISGLSLFGGIFLAAIFLSETLQRNIKLFISKHFYKDKYDYRLQWLNFIHRLAETHQAQDLYQAVLLQFCESLGMGQAALYLRNAKTGDFDPVHQWAMANADTVLPSNHPLCRPQTSPKFVADLRHAATFPPAPPASFCIALPRGQVLEGLILIAHPFNAEEVYDEEDFELMEALAHQAASAIINMHLADALAAAREMEALGKVSAFVLHDLKNLVHALSILVENAKTYIQEPEFQRDLFETLDNTVAKMTSLIRKLREIPPSESLRREAVDLLEFTQESLRIAPQGTLRVHGDSVPATIDRTEMSKVLINLFHNAQEACQGKYPVMVEVGRQGQPYIKISDSGCGMDDEFINKHLFVPFNTTKKDGMGIGLYQSKQIVEAHGGHLVVESHPGQGSTFTVLLPESHHS
ncbi:XrtA/PEP-CTERM system histidine kinase PrsK [Solidesulfovibrio sp.]|uniref:XrtA/PEP-CTERM system histidine kinase PrsK n=1 Tax=Solidesulfovibrio sp. TaxID=2910990 RepID=UPI00260DF012|nr:XrtA/PEP-CTERM system histidine kinase PrsK [Solidesulfovibrio sp.]